MSTTLTTLKAFNFEVYTKNPLTGEEGWEIKFPNIFAETKLKAREILKSEYPNFDVVILFNHSCEMDENDIAAYAKGLNYRDSDGYPYYR